MLQRCLAYGPPPHPLHGLHKPLPHPLVHGLYKPLPHLSHAARAVPLHGLHKPLPHPLVHCLYKPPPTCRMRPVLYRCMAEKATWLATLAAYDAARLPPVATNTKLSTAVCTVLRPP